jgi:dienelactone hydrolase
MILSRFGAVLVLFVTPVLTKAQETARLPGTASLTWQDDLSDKMMQGLHGFIEAKIAQSVEKRSAHWKRVCSSAAAFEKSIQPNRQHFQKIIGVVDPRLPVHMERFGEDDAPGLIAQTDRYRVYQVRWPVLDGVWGEGLLLEPKGVPRARAIALPDADQTPEQLVGLLPGVPNEAQFARRLVENGFEVVVPTLLDRSDRWSGNAEVAWTNQTHREWIYRQSYHMGRHVIGYEVQKILAVMDWFTQRGGEKTKIGVIGYGEGGLLAFYAAAVDPRIDACLVSGYFAARERTWEEPLYRNVWSLLREFGDAEIATLIAPRGLVVEPSEFPSVSGSPSVKPGRRASAAGTLSAPAFSSIQAEFRRIDSLLPSGFQPRQIVTRDEGKPIGPGSRLALQQFARMLGVESTMDLSDRVPADQRKRFDPAARQQRQVQELTRHVQRLVRSADRTRERFFSLDTTVGPRALESFAEKTPQYRQYLWEEVLGKFDDPFLPPNPRSRQVYDREKWVGYEVVIDVFPGVFAWGVLLLPKDIKPGEKRPVVVCQHGRNGLPKIVIEGDQGGYHNVAATLVERGFIVFAPHNPYRGEDRYRFLSRKANNVKASLFSFILAQHQQILNWLGTLPQVDAKRIAFYGKSYGGETAVRVPPLLERYCLSICSADFNDWGRKVASTDSKYSFMFTIEWEMPYFDMGNKFNYAELAALMVPRPFMVERGHEDGVAPDEWVAYEYAKVRRLYDRLGLGERTTIEFFNGGHEIHGQGTFDFLHKHLSWPKR